jgi:hypothetical protein
VKYLVILAIYSISAFCQLYQAIPSDYHFNDQYEEQDRCIQVDSLAVENCINNGISNLKSNSLIQKLIFIYKESMSRGSLDYYAKCPLIYEVDNDDLFCIDKTVYDAKDFGNFIWGATLKRLKLPYSMVKVGSEINAFFNCKKQNYDIETFLGICWLGDSPEDQMAIKNGYNSF